MELPDYRSEAEFLSMNCLPERPNQSDCVDNPEEYLTDFAARFAHQSAKSGPNQGHIWDEHRRESEIVEQLYQQAGLSNYGARIHDCSKWLGFALQAEDESEVKLRLKRASFCRVRHCPVCQWRRSLMWRARFLRAVPEVERAYPTHRWLFLTLTAKNVPLGELRVQLRHMNRAWERLRHRRAFPGHGFVKTLEVTRSEIGEAHPHFHCLILVPASYFSHGYLSQEKWTELWKNCLGVDYTPIVNVKAVKSRKGEDRQTQTIKAVLETLKYGVKVQDLVADSDWLAELTYQLKNARAVSVGGVLREFMSEAEPEDLTDESIDEEIIESDGELWFTWKTLKKRYVRSYDR